MAESGRKKASKQTVADTTVVAAPAASILPAETVAAVQKFAEKSVKESSKETPKKRSSSSSSSSHHTKKSSSTPSKSSSSTDKKLSPSKTPPKGDPAPKTKTPPPVCILPEGEPKSDSAKTSKRSATLSEEVRISTKAPAVQQQMPPRVQLFEAPVLPPGIEYPSQMVAARSVSERGTHVKTYHEEPKAGTTGTAAHAQVPARKGPWTPEEDVLLQSLVEKYGPKDWTVIASNIEGRIGKQCRERYFNHLAPLVKKDPWSPEEDEAIMNAHQIHGNQWTQIAKILNNGRPPNAIKNRWNSALKRKAAESDPTLNTKCLPATAQIMDRDVVMESKVVRPMEELPVANPAHRTPNIVIMPPQETIETPKTPIAPTKQTPFFSPPPGAHTSPKSPSAADTQSVVLASGVAPSVVEEPRPERGPPPAFSPPPGTETRHEKEMPLNYRMLTMSLPNPSDQMFYRARSSSLSGHYLSDRLARLREIDSTNTSSIGSPYTSDFSGASSPRTERMIDPRVMIGFQELDISNTYPHRMSEVLYSEGGFSSGSQSPSSYSETSSVHSLQNTYMYGRGPEMLQRHNSHYQLGTEPKQVHHSGSTTPSRRRKGRPASDSTTPKEKSKKSNRHHSKHSKKEPAAKVHVSDLATTAPVAQSERIAVLPPTTDEKPARRKKHSESRANPNDIVKVGAATSSPPRVKVEDLPMEVDLAPPPMSAQNDSVLGPPSGFDTVMFDDYDVFTNSPSFPVLDDANMYDLPTSPPNYF